MGSPGFCKLFVSLSVSALSCNPCEPLLDAGTLCGDKSTSLPVLERFEGYPVVQGSIDGVPANLLIDTGASGPVISAKFLGRPSEAWAWVDLCLGPLCLDAIHVWSKDTTFSQPGREDINGVIGMRVLQHFVLELDHALTLTMGRARSLCEGDVQPIQWREGRPYVRVLVDGVEQWVLLDTGAFYTLLSQQTSQAIHYLGEHAQETSGCDVVGCKDSGNFVSTLRQYCVGQSCTTDLPVKYPVWDALGMSYLKRYAFSFGANQFVLCNPSDGGLDNQVDTD